MAEVTVGSRLSGMVAHCSHYPLQEQIVLHGKQGSGDPSADSDLVVDVLEVVPHRVLAQKQLSSYLSSAQPSGQEAENLNLTISQSGRPLLWAAPGSSGASRAVELQRLQQCLTGVGPKALARFLLEVAQGGVSIELRMLGHLVRQIIEPVSDRDDPGTEWYLRSGESAIVALAVHPFVMSGDKWNNRLKGRHSREYSLRMVRMQTQLLLLHRSSLFLGLVESEGRHGDQTKIVHQGGSVDDRHLRSAQ